MVVKVENCALLNVWEESFKDRETGEDVQFFRALVSAVGEAPMQFGVSKDDYESVKAMVGGVGSALVDIDAQPGRRVRVRLVGME